MRTVAILATLGLLLAGCGADGPPEPPPAREPASAEPAPAITIGVSGTAEAGVAGTF